MLRFIRLPLLVLAVSGFASATAITMNSSATFVGGLDLAINSPDNNDTTRLVATYNGASMTVDFSSVGQVDWLALGTLQIGEGIAAGDTTPNIIETEHDGGYTLAVNVDTNLGMLNFIANAALFNTSGFAPGVLDSDTTDAAAEITVDFSTLNQTVTVGLVTYSLSIVTNQFGNNQQLEFNQNGQAATVWLRAEVANINEPPTGEVPEAGTMAMLGSGLVGVGLLARRRRVNRGEVAFA